MISTPEIRAHAQDILDFIHEHPEKHRQSGWIRRPDKTGCGTTMCIGGTSAWLKFGTQTKNKGSIEKIARQALGLSLSESHILFYEMDEERALQKLKKIVVGEFFSREDFYVCGDGGCDDEALFAESAWEIQSHVVNEFYL